MSRASEGSSRRSRPRRGGPVGVGRPARDVAMASQRPSGLQERAASRPDGTGCGDRASHDAACVLAIKTLPDRLGGDEVRSARHPVAVRHVAGNAQRRTMGEPRRRSPARLGRRRAGCAGHATARTTGQQGSDRHSAQPASTSGFTSPMSRSIVSASYGAGSSTMTVEKPMAVERRILSATCSTLPPQNVSGPSHSSRGVRL